MFRYLLSSQIVAWDPVPLTTDIRLAPPTKDVELEVMNAIYNLSNTVIANTASRSLAKCVLSNRELPTLVVSYLPG